MTDFVQLLPLALLGAVLGLDVVSFPQAMISRPLVAATAAATLLGDPGTRAARRRDARDVRARDAAVRRVALSGVGLGGRRQRRVCSRFTVTRARAVSRSRCSPVWRARGSAAGQWFSFAS